MAENHNRVEESIETNSEELNSSTESWVYVATVTEVENRTADSIEGVGSAAESNCIVDSFEYVGAMTEDDSSADLITLLGTMTEKVKNAIDSIEPIGTMSEDNSTADTIEPVGIIAEKETYTTGSVDHERVCHDKGDSPIKSNEQIGSISIDKADLPVLPYATLQDNGIKKIMDTFDADLKRLMKNQSVYLPESTKEREQTFASIDEELSKATEDKAQNLVWINEELSQTTEDKAQNIVWINEELSQTTEDNARNFVWINEELPKPTEEEVHTFGLFNKELLTITEERVQNSASGDEELTLTQEKEQSFASTDEEGSKNTQERTQNVSINEELLKTTEERAQNFATTDGELSKTTATDPIPQGPDNQTSLEEYFRNNDFSHLVPFEWHLENFSSYVETIHSPVFYVGESCQNEWKAQIELEKSRNFKDFELSFKLLTEPLNPVFGIFDLGLYNSKGEQIEKVLTGGWFGKIFQKRSCLRAYRPGLAIGNERPKVELHDDQLSIMGRVGFLGCCCIESSSVPMKRPVPSIAGTFFVNWFGWIYKFKWILDAFKHFFK